MSFASLVFLYFFLPAVLLGYYLLPRRLRNPFLLAANLVFYGWGEPSFLPVIVLTALLNWAAAREMIRRPQRKKLLAAGALALDFGLLALFKYADFALGSLGFRAALGLPLPLGISFYTFQVVSYIIDVYRGSVEAEESPVRFAAYLTFFPQLIAGPIVRYGDLREQLAGRSETAAQAVCGVRLLLIGLGKKVLIANRMGALWEALRANAAQNGIIGAWVGAIAFTLQIYFDFSGYSDMARGLGALFGFEIPINFDHPYCASSITEFWRRWHMTLSSWFRDYVYIPLGGSRTGRTRTYRNLLIVWALTGLWHGAAWNYVLWGLYYFVLLAAEKAIGAARLARLPLALRHGLTMLCVTFGWVLFALEDFSELGAYLRTLFTGSLLGAHARVLILSYLPMLLLSALCCLPLGQRLWARVERKPVGDWAALAGGLALLAVCTAALAAQSYNPFLYFRF
ncbi:MAG: MBOAT family protein [Clostridiales bacterium]|nr:MBOAT family protein [Clostridiales bacterium]